MGIVLNRAKYLTCGLALLPVWAVRAVTPVNYSPQSALVPLPVEVILPEKEGVDLDGGYRLIAPLELANESSELKKILSERMGARESSDGSEKTEIVLDIDPKMQAEEYTLSCGNGQLVITGGSAAGVWNGVMTLDQILIGDVPSTAAGKISAVDIVDYPRFGYRALMLDPARNFLPVDDVKRYIDRMARYKFNVLQLHLTDDEGWRMEIKSHPELTAIGAFRSEDASSGGPDNGFYTHEDLREIISHAATRHIEVVPELDIPGHTAALLAAHPEMRCLNGDTADIKIGDSHHLMLCASVPEVYTLYDDVIREVAQVFPSRYIHLGGDESVIDRNWGKCSRDSALMESLSVSSPASLMNHFFSNILSSVNDNDKEAILWCELDNIYPPANEYLFDYPQDVTLVTWRNGLTPKCIELTRRYGNSLIMAPGEYAYLDYPQLKGDLPEWNNWGMPVTTLRRSYEFDPGYGLPDEEQVHIKGVMATLWGEAIRDIHRASYMTYPRGLAIAEAAWTPVDRRLWDDFRDRMWPNIAAMMREGTSVRVPYEVSDNSGQPAIR